MRSCHLQMKSFIPAFLFCMLFTSFSCLVALSSTSVQCLIEVERVFIFVFLLISGRKLLVFHHEYDVNCEFFLSALYQVEEIPFYSFFALCLPWKGVWYCQMLSFFGIYWYYPVFPPFISFSSAQFSHSVVSNSLRPHESQHARPPCPSPTPRVHSNSCPSSQWCHPAISSSVIPFSSCPQSFPASGSFPVSQLFAWGGQSIGVSALASVFPMNTQDPSPFEWTGWISITQ